MSHKDTIDLLCKGRPVLFIHLVETDADRKFQDRLNALGIEYTAVRVLGSPDLPLPQLCVPINQSQRRLLDALNEEQEAQRPIEGQGSLPLVETAA